jgi:prolyl oligopeptidase
MITQFPKLFRAVVASVGIFDMRRFEQQANGEFNTTELGTVKDESQFRALYRYSPYHRVGKGVAYPSVLFLTGAHDPRVDPMQSRKMTARLQASGAPVLLRTSDESGQVIIDHSTLMANPSAGFESAGLPGMFIIARQNPLITDSTLQ